MASQDDEMIAFRDRVTAVLKASDIDVVGWDEDEEWLVVYDEASDHEFAVTVGAI